MRHQIMNCEFFLGEANLERLQQKLLAERKSNRKFSQRQRRKPMRISSRRKSVLIRAFEPPNAASNSKTNAIVTPMNAQKRTTP